MKVNYSVMREQVEMIERDIAAKHVARSKKDKLLLLGLRSLLIEIIADGEIPETDDLTQAANISFDKEVLDIIGHSEDCRCPPCVKELVKNYKLTRTK